jgi:hypothetical protein
MAPATQKELEGKMQVVGSELQKIELELQKCVEVRQRLDSQLNENDQVKKVSRRGVAATAVDEQFQGLKRTAIYESVASVNPLISNRYLACRSLRC